MNSWNNLSIGEKAQMMKVAIRNGITSLPEIKQAYNEFAEGGGISDKEYYNIMEKVAEDNYKNWGFKSPDEALVRALNDNTYNYRAYYDKYPQSTANADTHWTDEFKTVYHPTFSNESIYSGNKSQYNPNGLPGGYWVGENFIPKTWQILESNKFAEGGNLYAGAPVDNDLVDWIIKEEGFNKKPENIGDGKITLGSGLTDPKWHALYKKRGNVWSDADNRMAVAEEVAKRRKWAEKNIPNWDTLPTSSQKALLSYKYNYDFNSTNSPKLFKALADSDFYEAAKQMDATSKDPKFKKGLQERRRREQEWFLSGVQPPRPNPNIEIPVSTRVNNPYTIQADNTRVMPIMAPVKGSYVMAEQLSPQQQKKERVNTALQNLLKFQQLMEATSIPNIMPPPFIPSQHAYGGNLFSGTENHSSQMQQGHVYEVLPQMLRNAGLNVKVTSGYRKAGQAGNAGKKSWHTKHGAVDIVPQGKTTFEDIENALYNNPTISNYMLTNGFGLIDESGRSAESKATMKKTGATGAHFHIGKDSKYAKMYADKMSSVWDNNMNQLAQQIENPQPIMQETIPYTPWNPQALYNEQPLASYTPTIAEPSEPLIEAANAYSQEVLDREQRQRNLNTLGFVLGMTSPQGSDNSFTSILSMLT